MKPESLDDVDGLLVYADELQSRGDPHGTLIALQHGKKTRQANAWLKAHATELLGALAGNEQLEPTWQSGFIRAARLTEWEDDGPSFTVQYDQLRACPAAQLIRELMLSQAPMDHRACKSKQGYCYEVLLAHMAKHPLPTLRQLSVGGDVAKPEYNCALGLAPVLAKHPGLEELGINGGVYDLGTPALPNLRKLRILANHSGENVRELAGARLPALVELDLHGDAQEDHEPTPADYVKLFASDRMPALRTLEFSTNEEEVYLEACRALLASPLLRQLTALTLEFIDNAIADLVLEDPRPLRHLKKLKLGTLERGDVTPSRRTRLARALPKLS
jgi:hypothetical protein